MDAGLVAIIRNALAGVVVVRRRDGVVVEANEAFVSELGWSRDELVGKTTAEIGLYVDPTDRARIYEAFERDGKVVRMALVVRARSGAHRSCLLTMHPLAFAGEACAVAFWEDVTEVRRVDAALQQSEAQLHALFELASVGIVQIELSTHRFLRVNATMCELTGYSADELYACTVEALTFPDDRAADAVRFADFTAGRSARAQCDKRYVRKDGQIVWCSVDCRVSNGCVVAVILDITARRAAARALAEAEERNRLALDAAELGTWRYDFEAATFHLDPRAQRQFGVDRALVSETELFALLHPEDRTRLATALAAARAPDAAERSTIEHRIVLPDGGVRWLAVHVHLHFAVDREAALAFAACRDITATRAASDALYASEDRYRSLVDNLEDIVFSLDATGRITFVSRAVTRFGYDASAMLGRPVADYVHPDDRVQMRASLAARLAGATETGELRWLDARGDTRHLRYSSRPLIVDGHVVGITGLITDTTQQRETEAKLYAAQRMEAVGRLAGGVAHDFNNLLSVILSCAELAKEDVPAGSALCEDLTEIANAATRAAGLTRQLLAFSRRQVLEPERVELGQLVASLSSMLRRLIGEDIALHVDAVPALFAVVVDKGQLEQVVMNLAVNARDAMTEGGVLRIAMRNMTLDEPQATALEVAAGDYVELAITDTGTGIPDVVRDRIFEPFFTTKGVGKGTGLGLSMVHGMVKQSGGGIAVDTEVGHGTTFRIYLPRDATPQAAARVVPETAPVGPRGHERILLVEDDDVLRHVIERALVSVGYEVVAAANAADALARCENGARFDLVLTDVVMPGLDGKRLAERLPPLVGDARVLFMSGYTDDIIEQHGVLDVNFLRKPFAREALTAKVRSVLDEGRSGALSSRAAR